jgi:hypothetical protein
MPNTRLPSTPSVRNFWQCSCSAVPIVTALVGSVQISRINTDTGMIAFQKLSMHASPHSTAGHHWVTNNLRAHLDPQLGMIKTKKKTTIKRLSLLRMLINPLAALVLPPRKIPPQTRTSAPPTRRNLRISTARKATSLVIHWRYVTNQNLPSKYTQLMPMLMMHPLQATPLASLSLHNKEDEGQLIPISFYWIA